MYNQNKNLPAAIRRTFADSWHRVHAASQKPLVRLGVLGGLIFLLSQKEFSFSVSFGNPSATMSSSLVPIDGYAKPVRYEAPEAVPVATREENAPVATPTKSSTSSKRKTNVAPSAATGSWWEAARSHSKKMSAADLRTAPTYKDDDMNLANPATAVSAALTEEQKKKAASYSNLGFILNPDYAERNGIDPAIVAMKNQFCYDYIAKFAATAQEEARLYNIPASITLAQGLLESNAGESNLAKRDNNHFGIKCKDRCIGCRCANYTDDSRYDMFRIFESSWHSFREHSKLLTGSRYKHLLKLPRTDYKNWAYGLKSAGYATDPSYATKLIEIIEALQLYKYDMI